jgi:hypothetical protein
VVVVAASINYCAAHNIHRENTTLPAAVNRFFCDRKSSIFKAVTAALKAFAKFVVQRKYLVAIEAGIAIMN